MVNTTPRKAYRKRWWWSRPTAPKSRLLQRTHTKCTQCIYAFAICCVGLYNFAQVNKYHNIPPQTCTAASCGVSSVFIICVMFIACKNCVSSHHRLLGLRNDDGRTKLRVCVCCVCGGLWVCVCVHADPASECVMVKHTHNSSSPCVTTCEY